MTSEADVRAALAAVRDPELDEPVTELGFVAGIDVRGEQVAVRLRLPTYFCAPNFAWMMVADAERAVGALPGVARARVTLADHFASEQLATTSSFQEAFPGEADAELDDLRGLFLRKAFLARQYAVWEAHRPATLADVPPGEPGDGYLRRRAELGLDMRPDAPFLVTPSGDPVGDVEAHLRVARSVRVSIEGNAGLCRGLLATRYREEVAA